MAEQTNQLAKREMSGVQVRSIDEAVNLAGMVLRAGIAPRGLDTAQKIAVAMIYGAEVGIGPMMSLSTICVINGKPSIYGDGLMSLVRASGKLADYAEEILGEGESMEAVVTVKRFDNPTPLVKKFNVERAKKAKLWGKQGPWTEYPDRMLLARARSFALRDAFADVLAGLIDADEARDWPAPERIHVETVETPEHSEPGADETIGEQRAAECIAFLHKHGKGESELLAELGATAPDYAMSDWPAALLDPIRAYMRKVLAEEKSGPSAAMSRVRRAKPDQTAKGGDALSVTTADVDAAMSAAKH